MPSKVNQNQNQFEKDEKVLCFHGPLLYEAKILDLMQEDPKDRKSAWQYRVHYKGWKNTWDDWVPETRMRKLSEENRQLERELKRDMLKNQREEEAARKKSAASTRASRKSDVMRNGGLASEERGSSVSASVGRGGKRGRDNEIEKEETYMTRPHIRIIIPDAIKGLLVDDWENVTKNLQLVPLPHEYPVTQVLEDYRNAEMPNRAPGSPDEDILEEVIQGIREYFNRALGRILLYRFERQQYSEINHRMQGGQAPADGSSTNENIDVSGKEPCDVYGAEHLCRLFVSMPELIAQTNMDRQAVDRLREELTRLMNWLVKNSRQYFSQDYESPGTEYERKAKGYA